jgi:hypothetical protein
MSDITVQGEVIRQLVEIKNDLSVNGSLYSFKEQEQIKKIAEDLVSTLNMNLGHGNYFSTAVDNLGRVGLG